MVMGYLNTGTLYDTKFDRMKYNGDDRDKNIYYILD